MSVSTAARAYAAPADLLPAATGPGDKATALLTAVYAVLLGPAAGLVWAAVAPKLSVPALAAGSDATFRAQIGADAWFLLVGALAGALCALLAALALGEPGPHVAAGLAVGGLAAAFVADRVAYLSERGATSHALHAIGAHPGGALISELDFRIRALGVLTVWPIASLAVVGLVIAINASRR
jgi:hypothetical protein